LYWFDLHVDWQRNYSRRRRGKNTPAGNWQRNFAVAIFGRADPGAIAAKL
jgi:hypothetical protein